MIAPSTVSSAPTKVGNMAGPMRCMSPRRYWCASRMKPAPITTKNSPAQKSFGDRMRIMQRSAIRPDLGLLDNGPEALALPLPACRQFGRARGDRVDAAAREALLDIRHVPDLEPLGFEPIN